MNTSDMPPAIRIDSVVKRYAPAGKGEAKLALKGVSFDVPQGEIFGLLGPNGAGKSTLINILAGLVTKTAGSASIWGFDIDAQVSRHGLQDCVAITGYLDEDRFFRHIVAADLLVPGGVARDLGRAALDDLRVRLVGGFDPPPEPPVAIVRNSSGTPAKGSSATHEKRNTPLFLAA